MGAREMLNERKKYGISLAQNLKALLDELGIQSKLLTLSWGTVCLKVDTEITDDQIHNIYRRLDVNHIHYDPEKKELIVGIELPPVLNQFA